MRRGRGGARTRFPVVSGKANPFTGRIAGFWGTGGGKGGWETAVNPGGRWLLSPMKIHVSPFSVRQLGSASTRSRRDCGAAASPQLSLPAQTRLSPHEYVDLLTAQRLGGTSHYEGSTFDREENLTPCLPTRLDLRTVLFPLITDYSVGGGGGHYSETQTFASLKYFFF